MNDVLPPGTVTSNINKQDHSNAPGGSVQQQTGLSAPGGGGPINSNLSLSHGPFASGPLGGPGSGPRGTSSGGPGAQSQALDRLSRRVCGYRARQGEQLPKYNNTMNTINNQHAGETILLRQKFLDSTKNKKVKCQTTISIYTVCIKRDIIMFTKNH